MCHGFCILLYATLLCDSHIAVIITLASGQGKDNVPSKACLTSPFSFSIVSAVKVSLIAFPTVLT